MTEHLETSIENTSFDNVSDYESSNTTPQEQNQKTIKNKNN